MILWRSSVWQALKGRSKQPSKHREPLSSINVKPVQNQVKSGKITEQRQRDYLPNTPKVAIRIQRRKSSNLSGNQRNIMRRPAIIESDPASDEENDTIEDSDKSESEESEIEPAESIAKSLFGEVPTTITGSRQKTPHHRRLATVPPTPKTTSSSRSSKTPPQPIWGSQFKPFNSHVGLDNDKSFSEESILVDDESDDHGHTLNIKPEPDSANESDPEPHSTESSLQADPIAHIVYLKTWNLELRNVIQRGILEVKGHIAFEHSCPDLVSKNIYAREILLKAAQYHSAVPIEKQMRIDNEYLSALTNLIDARASLFHSDIKDVASKSISGYFRLGGSDNDTILDRLLANHSYIFPQTFDAGGLPSLNRQKPYQTQPVFVVMYEVFFKHLKSVGVQFGQRFRDIANNKGGCPEIPIPMLAIVCTAIRAILLAKKNGSSDDFKFTGNQFLDIYNHHVLLLGSIQKKAPVKFHKMMSDIYDDVHCFRHSNTGGYDQDDSLSFLDLDGMEDE
ncbi:hypothetical protein DFJ58DRAFT_842622 [Suillus subalutaceus]|uniref:uncharacterized protein n=1 Tax=Suillus subalutaceus TaxID=48586 RepID=UPI001B87F820|nr:uncharacterized protein DFJ58DRAFT_842622 [Suillus subalutaceus]KAG1849695.1 hypothetical protein DFJ58DRAFT_842622 [Suillus subalutaceus]